MHRSVLAIAILLAAHPAVAAMAETNPFLEAGIPAPSRTWTGPDYERTIEILTAGKVPLPSFADPQGQYPAAPQEGLSTRHPDRAAQEARGRQDPLQGFKKDEDARRLDQMIGELGGLTVV